MCTIVDGASIPEAFWSFIGGPFEGKYRNASVVHDFYCDTRTETWEDVHMVFYNGMRAAGVDPITAKIMYSAVYNFGPRWLQVNPGYTKKLIAGTPILLKDAKEAIVKFIQDNDPSLSEIRTISDKLSQLENFTQLEQLLEQYANCTPIIANEGGAHELLKRTIILCGMSEASTKRAALRNIRSLTLRRCCDWWPRSGETAVARPTWAAGRCFRRRHRHGPGYCWQLSLA